MAQTIILISVLLALYPYFIYPVIIGVVYLLVSLKTKTITKVNNIKPGVSIVLSVYNEEKVIKDKIENTFALDYPYDKLELVIGSDASFDSTNEIIHSFNDTRLKFFESSQRRGKLGVLKEIVDKARGDIIVITDANTILDKKALEYIIPNFEDKKVGGVCGRLILLRTKSQSNRYMQFYWSYENMLKSMESNVCSIMAVNGQIFAIRKELFQIKEEHLATEDQVLGLKLVERDFKLIFERKALAFEEVGDIWTEFKRRVRISSGNFQSFTILKELLFFRKGFRSFCFWSHKVLRNLTPVFLIIIFCSNLFLLKSSIYKDLFIAQVFIYCSTIFCFIFKDLYRFSGPFKFILSFTIMQAAVMVGFLEYLSKREISIWEKQR